MGKEPPQRPQLSTGPLDGHEESMKSVATMAEDLRERIIARPDVILDDRDVMRALIGANDKALGDNIVDLRGLAMERLESRLDRLEDTHRNVIAAAYENLAGTNQMHRAILRILEPTDFERFLNALDTDVAEILRVDSVRLVLESRSRADDAALGRVDEIVSLAEPGFIDDYLTRGRAVPVRSVTLRAVDQGQGGLYGEGGDWIRSEACVKLDLGAGRLPGMLAFGAEDPEQFTPAHGTDLIAFFAGVFERAMRRWLA
jgi:uncharacterized protein